MADSGKFDVLCVGRSQGSEQAGERWFELYQCM